MSQAITVTFIDPTYAARALDELESLHDSQQLHLSAAIVAVKDVFGQVTVDEVQRYVPVVDESGEMADLSPVVDEASHPDAPSIAEGDALPVLHINPEQAHEVVDRLPSASSALLFEYIRGSVDAIAAVIRELEGTLYTVDVTDEAHDNLETLLRNSIRP
jgi:uncharacterized membrane protein